MGRYVTCICEDILTKHEMYRIKIVCFVSFNLWILIRKQRDPSPLRFTSSEWRNQVSKLHDASARESIITIYYTSTIHSLFELSARLLTIFLPFVSLRRRGGPTRYEYRSLEKDSFNPHPRYRREWNTILTFLTPP